MTFVISQTDLYGGRHHRDRGYRNLQLSVVTRCRLAMCIAGITSSDKVLDVACRGASRLARSLFITRRNSDTGNEHTLSLNLNGEVYLNFDDLLL